MSSIARARFLRFSASLFVYPAVMLVAARLTGANVICLDCDH
jgi:hypothetical protein